MICVFIGAQSWSSRSRVLGETLQTTWSNINQDPVVSYGSDVQDGNEFNDMVEAATQIHGDASCTTRGVEFGADDSHYADTDCWYDTSIGLVNQGGNVFKSSYDPYAGLIKDGDTPLMVTPNPNVFIQLTPTATGGYYMDFRLGTNATPYWVNETSDYRIYGWTSVADMRLKDFEGNPWVVNNSLVYSQIAYSKNHEWMVIWDSRGVAERVNLTTLATSAAYINSAPYGPDNNYAQLAISDSGRYVAAIAFNDTTPDHLRLADFDRCQAYVQGDAPVCDLRFLDSYVRDSDSDLTDDYGAAFVRFYSDDILEDYVPMGGYYQQVLIRAPGTGQTNYIALGDSYASGEGEGNSTFFPGTDVHGVNMCHLSRLSYPFLIGRDLGLDSTHSVACSGAKTKNVLDTTQYPTIPKNNDLGDWLPGTESQIVQVDNGKPNIITISAAGDDIGFSNIVQRCVKEPDSCYSTYEDRLELTILIGNQFDKLVKMYTSLRNAAAPDVKLYVIGYPSVVKSGGNCGANVHLNANETVFANSLVQYLNDTISKAAQKAGVYFVDTTAAFDGYRLCEGAEARSLNDQYKEYAGAAVNGITVGHDAVGLPLAGDVLSNGSFHPTQFGYFLLKQWIERHTNNFTKPMPRPNPDIGKPVPNEYDALLDAPKSGRPIYPINYDNDLTNDVVFRRGAYGETVTPNRVVITGLQPLSTLRGWLHSDPVDLGSYTADAEGNFSADISIPSDVSPGFHTLYFYATTADGQTQEFFKTVYVAASPNDLDGDGVPNTQEPCLIFEVPAGQLTGDGYDCSANAAEYTDVSLVAVAASTDGFIKDQPSHSAIASDSSNPAPSVVRHNVRNPQHTSSKQDGSNWLTVGVMVALIALLIAITLTFFLRLRYAED